MTQKLIVALILTTCSLMVFAQVPPATEPAETTENAETTETKENAANADKDKQYVTDQLRLSLYAEANSQSKVLKLLRSGDALIIDEIRGPYALVTDADGIKGWVKRGFLDTNPTANILLLEEQEKNASLFEEIEKLSNSKAVIDTYEKDMNALTQKVAELEADKQEAEETVSELQQKIEATQLKLEQKMENKLPPHIVLKDTFLAYWKFIVPLLLVLVLICFLITKVVIEAHIKSKFHGIKIW